MTMSLTDIKARATPAPATTAVPSPAAIRAEFEPKLTDAIGKATEALKFNSYARAIFLGLAAEHVAANGITPESLTLGELARLGQKAAQIHADRVATRLEKSGALKHPTSSRGARVG
jgi:hypothetical protein